MDNYYNIVINPMVSNIFEGSDKLENVLLLEKLTLNADNNLLNWSCPICFDSINVSSAILVSNPFIIARVITPHTGRVCSIFWK